MANPDGQAPMMTHNENVASEFDLRLTLHLEQAKRWPTAQRQARGPAHGLLMRIFAADNCLACLRCRRLWKRREMRVALKAKARVEKQS
jgi:hypothetical protein